MAHRGESMRVLPTLRTVQHEEEGGTARNVKKVVDDTWQEILGSLDLHTYTSMADFAGSFVESTKFNVGMGVVICFNVLVIGLDTDVNSNADKAPHMIWPIMYNAFCFVWVMEAAAKIYYYRCRYFKSGWNLLDFFLACLSVLDAAWIQPNIETAQHVEVFEFSLYRMVRILKLLRFIRLLRVMRLIQEVFLITEGFLDALRTLVWVFVLLFLAIYCGSIYTTTIVGQTCHSDFAGKDFSESGECTEFYGKVPASAVSLFQVLTLDAWAERLARPVLEVKPHLILFFVPFLFVTTYGVLNIVIGVVVENTLNVTKNNKTLQRERAQKELHQELELLRHIFEDADENHSGTMDREEMRRVLKRSDVQEVFQALELPYHEVDTLFDMIDVDKSGELSIQAFVTGALRHKGAPPGFDIRSMAVGLKGIARRVDRMDNFLHRMVDAHRDSSSDPLVHIRDDSVPSEDQATSSMEGREPVSAGLQLPGFQRSHTANSLKSSSSTGTPISGRRVQLPATTKAHPENHSEDIYARLYAMEQSLKEVKQEQLTSWSATKELRTLLEAIALNLGVSEEAESRQLVHAQHKSTLSMPRSHDGSMGSQGSQKFSSPRVESVRILSDVALRNESIEQELYQQAALLREAGKALKKSK